jgi:hypothetical protein
MFKRVFLLTWLGRPSPSRVERHSTRTLSTRVKQQASAPAYNPNLVILYDQNTTRTPTGNAVSAQNFEAVYNAYDGFPGGRLLHPVQSALGDSADRRPRSLLQMGRTGDFVQRVHHKTMLGCRRTRRTRPPPRLNQTYSVVGNIFRIKREPDDLDSRGTAPVPRVQANMNFNPNGQWVGAFALCRQATPRPGEPGWGFGICPTWGIMQTCIGLTGVPDLLFTIYGFHTFAE